MNNDDDPDNGLGDLGELLWAASVARFKQANPECDEWAVDVKLERLKLWLQEELADTPEKMRELNEARRRAKEDLLLE
jgi:hypothetical protein